MALIKISELENVTELTNNDMLPIVNNDETKNVTLEQLKNNIIAEVTTIGLEIVESVNDVTEPNVIYFVPNTDEGTNIYDEYILVDGTPELIASKEIDLSSYTTETKVEEMIDTAIGTALEGEY